MIDFIDQLLQPLYTELQNVQKDVLLSFHS